MTESPGLPQIQFMFACENVTQDMAQNFTFSNVLESLRAQAFPTMTLSMYIVFGVQNVLPGVYTASLSIEHSDGKVLIEQSLGDFAASSKQERARFVVGLRNFSWPRPGRFVVKLHVRDAVIGAFSLDVIEQSQPIIFQPPT